MNYTPGPWEVCNGGNVFTKLGAPDAAGIQAADDDGWFIADCDMGGLPIDQVMANAKLIAMAPTMVEAIKSLLDMPELDGTKETEAVRRNRKKAAANVLFEALGVEQNPKYLELWADHGNAKQKAA